jgi:hypothetical protein
MSTFLTVILGTGISWVARHGVNLFALRLLGSGFCGNADRRHRRLAYKS